MENMGSQQRKLQPYQYSLLREHKSKIKELQRIRRIVYSPWFKKRLGTDEQVLMYKQYNLIKDLVKVLNDRIEIFREENPKPGK